MRFILFLALLLLPSLAQAQADQAKCLVEDADGNRVSGTVEYVSYQHPRGFTIRGYKLVLLKPRCYETIDIQTDERERVDIDEMAIWNYGHVEFLRSLIGKTVVISGTMQGIGRTVYYVAWPLIIPGSLEACEITPKSKGVEKC